MDPVSMKLIDGDVQAHTVGEFILGAYSSMANEEFVLSLASMHQEPRRNP